MTSYTNADFHPHMEGAGGDKPDLLQEVERMGSVTQFLERGFTLHYSGVTPGWRGLTNSSLAQLPYFGVYTSGLERDLLLLFVSSGQTVVQSTQSFWSP